MADKVVLYGYFRSSCSWRVRIALALKNIPYEYEAVHLVKGQQKTDEYKKMNPSGYVPTLKIDGLELTQSLPIIEYLDERNPETPLLPKDMVGKAQVRAIAEVMNSGIQPLHNLKVLQKVGETKIEWANYFVTEGLEALEAMLEKTAGTYCYGDKVTIADICLTPTVASAKRFNVDMSRFPIISRINKTLEELPAFKAADARRQPDTPEDLRIE